MGTGLGPESYAIIEQGRIGQILSNKPADRRAIIEEAAGIGKYKTRKRLAESKLESAKQNLARVFDILEEVSRQANSLKRQASKAKRYEELRTDMLTHLRRAVAGRFQMLESEAAKLALDLTAGADQLPNSLRRSPNQGTGIRAHPGILLSGGSRAHRIARPRRRAQPRSRAHPQPPGPPSQANRSHRRTHGLRRNRNPHL